MSGHQGRQKCAGLRLQLLDAIRQLACGGYLAQSLAKSGKSVHAVRRVCKLRRTVFADVHSVHLVAVDLEGPSNGRHRMLREGERPIRRGWLC